MNDEIKEILDRIETASEIFDCLLNPEECTELLDYITNLQQAIEVKTERIKEEQQEKERYIKFYNELNIWNKDLQQENERLKEANVCCNRTDCVGRIKDSRKYDSVYQEKEDYKSRCEKAIEYIKRFTSSYDKCVFDDWANPKDLLNILEKGSDSQ